MNSDFDVTLDVGNCNVDNVLSSGMKTSAPSVTTNICILGTFQTQIRDTEKDSETRRKEELRGRGTVQTIYLFVERAFHFP